MRLVECAREAAKKRGYEVKLLLGEGWEVPKCRVSTKNPCFRAEVELRLLIGYKGRERHVVVLVVNEISQFERAWKRLHAEKARAQDQLVAAAMPAASKGLESIDLAWHLNEKPLEESTHRRCAAKVGTSRYASCYLGTKFVTKKL